MTVAGKPVRALVQLSKQGYAYVLDRVTGEPLWPIEERPVPASDVPGERAWPTQPHPTKPAPYEYQGYVESDFIDFTPDLRAEAIRIAKQYRLGPLFTPPSEIKEPSTKGTWYNPGSLGGSLWQSGCFDPENNYFYIPSKTGPSVVTVANDPKSDLRFSRGPRPDLSLKGLPILKPPYSRITALDLNTGDYAWVVPLGTTPQSVAQNPVLAGITLPNTGGIGLLATLLVTKTLLIAGEGIGQPGSSTASSISWCAAPMGRYWRTTPTKRASEPTRSTVGTLTARPSSKNAWSSPSKIRPSGTPISG
jgi:quinoprotein glucose dehydrogenase